MYVCMCVYTYIYIYIYIAGGGPFCSYCCCVSCTICAARVFAPFAWAPGPEPLLNYVSILNYISIVSTISTISIICIISFIILIYISELLLVLLVRSQKCAGKGL